MKKTLIAMMALALISTSNIGGIMKNVNSACTAIRYQKVTVDTGYKYTPDLTELEDPQNPANHLRDNY